MPAPKHPGGHGSGGGRRRKKGGHGGGHEEGGSERWLVTYADMLTLLLVLFIVLFSISVVNTSKFISLKSSLAAVFGDGSTGINSGGNSILDSGTTGTGQQFIMPGTTNQLQDGGSQSAGSQTTATGISAAQAAAAAVAAEKNNFTKVEKSVEKALQKQHMQRNVHLAIDHRGLVITVVTNDLVFGGNSATLETEGQQILGVIAPTLAAMPNDIAVYGYTNQLNTGTGPFASGWALSSARASAVAQFLMDHKVADSRLSAIGRNDNDPLYAPSDPRAATQNRRVEIVVQTSLPSNEASQLDPKGTSGTTSLGSSSSDSGSGITKPITNPVGSN